MKNEIEWIALRLDGEPADPSRDRPTAAHAQAADRTGTADAPDAARGTLSFDELYAEHAAKVVGLLLRLGVSQADVQDVAQEVFISIHAKLPGFEWRSTPSTWVHGFCVRKASDYRRKLARRRETPMAGLPDTAGGGEPERHLVAREQMSLLQQALASLPEKQMQVFVLYEVEQLPMPEVAAIVGCPLFTGYTWHSKAMHKIESFFAKHQKPKGRP